VDENSFSVTKLSVNVNKIATLRNSRGGKIPHLISFCGLVLDSGADGITIHPREDERHINSQDVWEITEFMRSYNQSSLHYKEFNIEGEPSPRFLQLVERAKPDQVTLVPVRPGEITSDHGFRFSNPEEKKAIEPFLSRSKGLGLRVSVFVEPIPEEISFCHKIGADRIELYTGPFAHAFDQDISMAKAIYEDYVATSQEAQKFGLGINAGHDLDTHNLAIFKNLPGLLEVSIGHRLVSDALVWGMEKTIKEYKKALLLGA